jgi:hypothetical protein
MSWMCGLMPCALQKLEDSGLVEFSAWICDVIGKESCVNIVSLELAVIF